MNLPRPFHSIILLVALAIGCCFFASQNAHAIIDVESPPDGLDDVWEALFGAQALLPGDDEDRDGYTNLEECIAGTDPFDIDSRLAIESFSLAADRLSATITFPTENGKLYRLELTTTAGASPFDFTPEPAGFYGTGVPLTISISDSADTAACGGITQDLWIGTIGDSIGSLTGRGDYPDTPTGSRSLARLETPSNVDENYGGRMRGLVTPPQSGNYTFFLTGSHSAELLLSTDDSPSNAVVVATLDSATQSASARAWETYDTQDHSVSLVAGQKYYIEARHIHGTGADYCAVGWSGPGIPAGDPDPGPIQVVGGKYLCPVIDGAVPAAGLDGASLKLVRVAVQNIDSDGDGVDDWSENQLHGYNPFKGASTSSGFTDAVTVANALGATGEAVDLSVIDALACENNQPFVGQDVARFRIRRTGSLQPLAVSFFPSFGYPLLQLDAQPNDYQLKDVHGNPLGNSIILPFGAVDAEIIVKAVDDGVPEYPEKVTLSLGIGDYTASPFGTQVECDIEDLPDHPANNTLFSGVSQPEPGSVGALGSMRFHGLMNGPKNRMIITTSQSSGFSSPQNDSHIHRANPGPSPGNIIYEITTIPGDPASAPLLGILGGYPWDIENSGGMTARRIINALYNQFGEDPLYINWHTNNNQSGELWALIFEDEGSVDPPAAPAPPPALPFLAGDDLYLDCFRFLSQATFGATPSEVQALVDTIENERLTNPAYSRIDAFGDWLDQQIATPQTWLVDYVVAADNQEWKLRGFFDGSRYTNPASAPPLPSVWPSIDRSDSDPTRWFPAGNYPLSDGAINAGGNVPATVPLDLGEIEHWNRVHGHWALMLNAKDQVRQKLGYALQQIVVVSDKALSVKVRHVANANYQDMINTHAFDHYRDVLGHVAWSPVMGKWLSSLKNQKATYDDNGTPLDTSDDILLFSPDENLAREIMQLFSIGLFEFWLDGTKRLSADTLLPVPSYDITDITELARILTGQSFSRFSSGPADWGITGADSGPVFDTVNSNGGILFNENNPTGSTELFRNAIVLLAFARVEGGRYMSHQFNYPMNVFAEFHDLGVKTIAGGKVIDNTALSDGDVSASGGRADEVAHATKDIEDALDWLAGKPGDGQPDFDMVHSHRSTPAFISRRLIQRFVTSNPSKEYLYRVAEEFAATEGDLAAVIRKILLDYEARSLDFIDIQFGIKKSPLEAYMQINRALGSHSLLPVRKDQAEFPNNSAHPGFPVAGGAASDLYLENFGYPAAQAANFTLNSLYPYADTDLPLSMSPFSQPTVFNFYLPDYAPSGVIAATGLVSPEMQIATETDVMRNINYVATIAFDPDGENESPLGGNPETPGTNTHYNQRLFWGDDPNAVPDTEPTDNNDNIRIDHQQLADTIISWGNSIASELDDMTALVDNLDRILMGGNFARAWPYNPADDGGAGGPNPREIVINALVDMSGTSSAYYQPYNNNATIAAEGRLNLFRSALYMMTATPEFMVRK